MTAENATNLVGRSEPVLSVVYVTLDDYRTNQASVRNLAQQTAASSIEVVFVCPDPQRFQSDEEDLSPFSGWQVIGVGNLLGAGEAMAAGIRAARGSLVGYGEEHSYPTPDWAERIIADFEAGPWSAVGFAMDNHNPQTMTSWAHLYGQFGSVVAPVSSGEVEVAGGHHVVYRHEVLLKFGDDLGRMMEDECALFFHLRERGYKIYLDGEAVAAHTNVEQWHAMAWIEYYGHRGFAATRAMHWSWPRRVFYTVALPLVPPLRFIRLCRNLKRTGRLWMMPRMLPVLTYAFSAGMVGEGLGYLVGPGRSATHKLDFELDRYSYTELGDRPDRITVATAANSDAFNK